MFPPDTEKHETDLTMWKQIDYSCFDLINLKEKIENYININYFFPQVTYML